MMKRTVVYLMSIWASAPVLSHAAEITWGPATSVADVSEVSTVGTTVEAGNAGGSGAADVTVNGVLFSAVDLLDAEAGLADAYTGDIGDAAYNTLLSDIDYGNGGSLGNLTLGGGNLTPDTPYLIQVWFADTRNASRQMQFGDGEGNTVTLSASGQYATGSFTADGTTQTLSFDAVNMGNAHITAYQIRTYATDPTLELTTATNEVSAPFSVDVTFSEPVTGLEESDFIIENGAVTASSLPDNNAVHRIEVTPTATGDVTVQLPAGSVTDMDGDGNSNPASDVLSVFYLAPGSDYPTVELSTESFYVGGTFSVEALFSEAVSGLEAGDFTVVNGTVLRVSGSGAAYTVEIVPEFDGLEITGDNDSYVRVALPENSVTDLDGDGLGNTASGTVGAAFCVPEAPGVTLYGSLSNNLAECTVYVTFSQEVSGFDASDISVENGRVVSLRPMGRSYSHEGYFYSSNSCYYAVDLVAASPGTVEVVIPAGVVASVYDAAYPNTASETLRFECTSKFGAVWTVDEDAEWADAMLVSSNLTMAGGMVAPTADRSRFTSVVKSYSVKKQPISITFKQSPVWDNWRKASSNIGASGAGDAPVLLAVGDKDYYFLGKKSGEGYHAWHSTNMEDWTHYGPITPVEHRYVATAEYKDGKFYIFLDYPNDHTPHLYIDDDLKDGEIGNLVGMVYNDPTHGSDCAIMRDNADGLFHMISEDWTPLNASTHAWDSPLATHVSSLTATNGFTSGEHVPPIDLRSMPTGKVGSFPSHSTHREADWMPDEIKYEIHEPEQEAFGDWTSIKVGDEYYLFADYDHPDGSTMSCARFNSRSIYEPYERVGELECDGHPDPTVGFAEGQFYLITQKSDFTSPGPWVEGVEARAGVDIDGDGTVDQWTGWQAISESYDHTPGFARVVTTTPARIDLSVLDAGYGFQFEFKVDDTVTADVSPIMDKVMMEFEPSNFRQWANTNGIPAEADADYNGNGTPDVMEFLIGQTVVPTRQADGTMTVTAVNDAVSDGLELELWFTDSLLEFWYVADTNTAGVKLQSETIDVDGNQELVFEIFDRNGTNIFWKLVVVAPEFNT